MWGYGMAGTLRAGLGVRYNCGALGERYKLGTSQVPSPTRYRLVRPLALGEVGDGLVTGPG